jgi:hypothetical protein
MARRQYDRNRLRTDLPKSDEAWIVGYFGPTHVYVGFVPPTPQPTFVLDLTVLGKAHDQDTWQKLWVKMRELRATAKAAVYKPPVIDPDFPF